MLSSAFWGPPSPRTVQTSYVGLPSASVCSSPLNGPARPNIARRAELVDRDVPRPRGLAYIGVGLIGSLSSTSTVDTDKSVQANKTVQGNQLHGSSVLNY